MLCCLAVQLQGLVIGVTTKDPDIGPVPQSWDDVDSSDQYWYVYITDGIGRSDGCTTWHRELQLFLDYSAGNTFGCHVSGTGELHLHHNGRDVGVAWEGLPTDQPLWGLMEIGGGINVKANYVIPIGEAVMCDVMFVSLYTFVHASLTLYFAWLLSESDRDSSIHSIVSCSILSILLVTIHTQPSAPGLLRVAISV